MFDSLENAIKAAINAQPPVSLSDIRPERWGETYPNSNGEPRTADEVRAAWEAVAGAGIEPPLHAQPSKEVTDE